MYVSRNLAHVYLKHPTNLDFTRLISLISNTIKTTFTVIICLNSAFQLHQNISFWHQSAASMTENKDIREWRALKARNGREERKEEGGVERGRRIRMRGENHPKFS